MEVNEKYMKRALELARLGYLWAHPNPLVGAVIVDSNGKVIGEGFHRKCGEAHAEVNAINSVVDKESLKDSTMYVTLEPCCHKGRTGPCCELIISCGIPRVVVGMRDPFAKVNGKGIERLKEAGIEVVEGVMEKDCRDLNAMFCTAHTLHRPFICLKWAQSQDGYMDTHRSMVEPPTQISTPLTRALVHRLRAVFDAVLVGANTVLYDNPRLDVRYWEGPSPRPVILDRRGRVNDEYQIWHRNPLIFRDYVSLRQVLFDLYSKHGVTSLLVEGGSSVLHSFINENLWDLAHVEIGPEKFGDYGTAPAPKIEGLEPIKIYDCEGQIIKHFNQNPLIQVKNI